MEYVDYGSDLNTMVSEPSPLHVSVPYEAGPSENRIKTQPEMYS